MIKIDEKRWIRVESNDSGVKSWHDENGTQLVLNSIGYDADLYPKLKSLDAVRVYYRDCFAEQGIGIIECEISETNNTPCVKVIGKKISQGKPGLYIGSLAIPLTDKSFVLSLYSQEQGVTGVRDTTVLTRLMQNGDEFEPDAETGKMKGWAQDPYFPDYDGPCLKNRSEDRVYDSDFPDHPLSKVRNHLDLLLKTVVLENSTKPWWKVW